MLLCLWSPHLRLTSTYNVISYFMNERDYEIVEAKSVFQMVLTSCVNDLEKKEFKKAERHMQSFTHIGIVVSTNVRYG